jgi:hypothetical protein
MKSGVVCAQEFPATNILFDNDTDIIKSSSFKELENISKIDLNLENKEKHTLKISEPVKKLDGELFEKEKDIRQTAFEIQKKKDIEDIKNLWEATIERNNVIKFAVKKLAIPPEQRRLHSSMMTKTLSALISGVSIIPNMLGADSITTSASLAGGSLTKRIIRSKTMPKEMPITDTELIQLAGLVEELQNKLIKNYYDYKGSIESLITCRQKIVIQNRNYSNAITNKNDMSVIVASAMYDKLLMEELKLKQKIKLNRLELERLAGSKSVANLTLSKTVDNDAGKKLSLKTEATDGQEN